MREEGPETFKSFDQLPPLDQEEGVEKKLVEPKPEKKTPNSLGQMLLGQMGLMGEDLKIKKEEGELQPLDFFILAIETGWQNNPNKIPGEKACWGPTVLEAYKLYSEKTEKRVDRDLDDVIGTGNIDYIPEKRGNGYMLKIVRQD